MSYCQNSTNQSNLDLIKKIARINFGDANVDLSFLDERFEKTEKPEQKQEDTKTDESLNNIKEVQEPDTIFDEVIKEYKNSKETKRTQPELTQQEVSESTEPIEQTPTQVSEAGTDTKGQPDVSEDALQQLLAAGYDIVKWVMSPERHTVDSRGREYDSPCGKCALTQMRFERMSSYDDRLPNGYIWLADFLATPITHGRIDDLTHPDCTCQLHVTKLADPNDVRVVTRNGLN